eukprot:UN09898
MMYNICIKRKNLRLRGLRLIKMMHLMRKLKKKEFIEQKEEIGSTRLNIKNKENFNGKLLLGNNNKKWSELSETLPSIKVFHCGHFYHVDCYRDAQCDKKYNIMNEDEDEEDDDVQDKCLICFSGHGSAQTKSKQRNYRY